MIDLLVRGGRSRENSNEELTLPGDKSISHRALTLAAAAPGPTLIRGLNRSRSVTVLVDALAALGAAIEEPSPAELRLAPIPKARPGVEPRRLDLGSSSAAARHLLGQLAALGIDAILDGDAVLRAQPMWWVVEPLRELGARIDYCDQRDRLPVRTRPAVLRGGSVSMAVGSAQVRSVLLLAATTAGISVRIAYPVRSRDHTERLLRHLGVEIEEAAGTLAIHGAGVPPLGELEIPGDPSALAYPAAAHVLSGSPGTLALRGVCLNPTRTGFLELLRQMGVAIAYEDVTERFGEPVGTVLVGPRPPELRPFAIREPALFHALIDEVPVAFAVAARASGTSTLEGGGELAFKETDRLESTRAMLAAFGADVEVAGHALRIEGGRPLRPGTVPSFGDHRVAMAAAALATSVPGVTRIAEGCCYGTSFPGFVACMRAGGWDLAPERGP
jgi:3-phosphoshikimate 1-carboxyvinyltransferase